VLSY